MNANEFELLKSSFEALKPVAEEFADRFYDELFAKHPAAKPLFDLAPGGLAKQKMNLLQSLVFIFDNLENEAKLVDYLQKMGQRHIAYGAQPVHYEWVANVMLSTLAYFFDDTWTPELSAVWNAALQKIAGIMLSGAASVAHPAASFRGLPAETPASQGEETVATAQAHTAAFLRDQIESTLREVIKGVLDDIMADREVNRMARAKAKQLIQHALDKELSDLRARPTVHARKTAS